jgi:hypothetical protein
VTQAEPIYRELAALGLVGYRVGSDGSIWSSLRRVPGNGGRRYGPVGPWRLLKPTPNNYGYPAIEVAGGRRHLVHTLVLRVFVGECPEGMQCCHADGNRTNNALANLSWGTPKDNAADRDRHGTTVRCERHGCAKLTPGQVREIRVAMAQPKRSVSAIARQFGVDRKTCRDIANGNIWKALPDVGVALAQGK